MKYSEYNVSDFHGDVDPVNNFYYKIASDFNYLTDDKLISKFKNIGGLSIIYFNCMSVRSCFENLKR